MKIQCNYRRKLIEIPYKRGFYRFTAILTRESIRKIIFTNNPMLTKIKSLYKSLLEFACNLVITLVCVDMAFIFIVNKMFYENFN